MDNLLVFQNDYGRTIIFEPKGTPPNGFAEAKKWLNSVALETGNFPEYMFNKAFCRKPTTEEVDYYLALKDRSIYALNAE